MNWSFKPISCFGHVYYIATEFSTVQRVLAVLQHVADNIDKDKISGITGVYNYIVLVRW